MSPKWIRWSWGIGVALLLAAGSAGAQEPDQAPADEPTMAERSLEFRKPTKPPSFLNEGRPVPWIGIYFGVGLRDVGFTLEGQPEVRSREGLSNGAGFDLGFFWDRQSIEYTRHLSFVELQAPTELQDSTGSQLEVEQHTIWWSAFPLRWKDWHFMGSAGPQFSRVRLADTAQGYLNEASLAVGAGVAYFPSRSLMLMYRASYAQRLLGMSDSRPALARSQLHALFINYYFSL